MTEALDIAGLSVTYRSGRRQVQAVKDVSLTIGQQESLALVGESGSGKSTIGAAVQGLLCADPTVEMAGTVSISGREISIADPRSWAGVRGRMVTTVFQDPMTSLNPLMTVGAMLDRFTKDRATSLSLLDDVEIRNVEAVCKSYPHQLSGGMRQRVMIALALSKHPSLLIADEPTTALDVSVQTQVLKLLKERQSEDGFGLLFITHDLGVARVVSGTTAVMQHGVIVEVGATDQVFDNPSNDYTRRLMRSRITLATERAKPLGVPDRLMAETISQTTQGTSTSDVFERWSSGDLRWAQLDSEDVRATTSIARTSVSDVPIVSHVTRPSLALNDVSKSFKVGNGLRPKRKEVLHHVTMDVGYRESVALVGESGSGKSTILRIAAGLEMADSGGVSTEGAVGEGVQVVFQDAGSSLTPWLTVGSMLEERVRNSRQGRNISDDALRRQILTTLGRVGLDPSVIDAKPAALSGGQRQRIVIARAVVVPPSILLCDEPTSALDVSVACSVLNLIQYLHHSLGISVLFVTHDLAVARYIADRVLVLQSGNVIEESKAESLDKLASDYGKELLHAILS
jgi:peptide/nickel transport system ATP-binding protein